MIALGGKTGKAFRFGGKDAAKIEVKKNGTWETVWTAEPAYDYGDGHLNAVKGGYNNTTFVYTASEGIFKKWGGAGSVSYWSGNFRPHNSYYDYASVFKNSPATQTLSFARGVSGVNTRTFSVNAQPGEMSVCLYLHYGGNTPGISVGELKVNLNGTDYTLQQAVNADIIKPFVFISSGDPSGNYCFPTAENLYSGDSAGTGNYPGVTVIFMINKGNVMSGFSYSASKAGGGGSDGSEAYAAPIGNFRMVVAMPE